MKADTGSCSNESNQALLQPSRNALTIAHPRYAPVAREDDGHEDSANEKIPRRDLCDRGE